LIGLGLRVRLGRRGLRRPFGRGRHRLRHARRHRATRSLGRRRPWRRGCASCWRLSHGRPGGGHHGRGRRSLRRLGRGPHHAAPYGRNLACMHQHCIARAKTTVTGAPRPSCVSSAWPSARGPAPRVARATASEAHPYVLRRSYTRSQGTQTDLREHLALRVLLGPLLANVYTDALPACRRHECVEMHTVHACNRRAVPEPCRAAAGALRRSPQQQQLPSPRPQQQQLPSPRPRHPRQQRAAQRLPAPAHRLPAPRPRPPPQPRPWPRPPQLQPRPCLAMAAASASAAASAH